MSAPKTVQYVLGHAPEELARLERQSAIFEAPTRALFARAGLAAGSRVLDIGCGGGDVSMLVAEFVGPAGAVIGVDRSPEAIATARRRAAARGFSHVRFIESTLEALELPTVDAAVGRFVLMHQPDPAVTLARVASFVRPGGVVAMMESHLDALVLEWHSWPASAAYGTLLDVMLKTIKAAGGRTDMGLRLRRTFLDAGLPDPGMDVHGTLAGHDAERLCRYMSDSLRSMKPTAARLGVASLTDEAIDRLEEGMIHDAARPGAVMNGPVAVTAWATVP